MTHLVCSLLLSALLGADPTYDPAPALAVIAKAGQQGAGAAEAAKARDELAQRGLEILPALLVSMDTSNPVAANWYRTVYHEIVTRELAKSQTQWPVEFLKDYVSDSQRSGRPRRLVLGLVEQLDPTFKPSWLPTRLSDPEFRFEAVALAMTAGEQAFKSKDQEAAKAHYRKAFEHARDSTQVAQSAAKLKTLGERVDVARHLGLVVDWWLLGPFDAPGKTGFKATFEPEQKVDLQATYSGKDSAKLVWKRHHEAETLGQLNLIKELAQVAEAVGYAYCEIEVDAARPAQLRCGADDNCSVWLNGEKVFAREQWLNGTRFDRFVTPITLKAGRNTLLVKVCQGPQHKDPEVQNNWSVQLRLCDEQGRGIAFRAINPVRDGE